MGDLEIDVKKSAFFLFCRNFPIISPMARENMRMPSHARHSCSKKGAWCKKVKSHMFWCMTLKMQNYAFQKTTKCKTWSFSISKILILLFKNFQLFPFFYPKWPNLSQFFFKYDFLSNYSWFRQSKWFCHKTKLKFWGSGEAFESQILTFQKI